jgi:hypothetical protein
MIEKERGAWIAANREPVVGGLGTVACQIMPEGTLGGGDCVTVMAALPWLLDRLLADANAGAAERAAWIPVEELLPEVGELVMLFAPMVSNRFSVGYCGASPEFTSTGAALFVSSYGPFQKSDVTHWRPLPAPPLVNQ